MKLQHKLTVDFYALQTIPTTNYKFFIMARKTQPLLTTTPNYRISYLIILEK